MTGIVMHPRLLGAGGVEAGLDFFHSPASCTEKRRIAANTELVRRLGTTDRAEAIRLYLYVPR